MMTELRLNIDRPDVILRPDIHEVGMFDVVDPKILIEAGRQAVEANLVDLRRESSWRGRIDRIFRRISPVIEPQVLRQFSLEPAPEDGKANQS
jgi:hypothetical protein